MAKRQCVRRKTVVHCEQRNVNKELISYCTLTKEGKFFCFFVLFF